MSDVELNLDPEFQLPSFKLPNGPYEQGDTGHNTYTVLYCNRWVHRLHTGKQLLWSADGWPRRSPDTTKWYGRPSRCSRDLLTPVLCYEAQYGQRFGRLMLTMAKYGFLFANNTIKNHVYEDPVEHAAKATPDVAWDPHPKVPDVLGPDIWAICIRGAMKRCPALLALWPLLCVLDLHGLLAALGRKLRPHSNDQRNAALKHHISAHLHPTPVSKLAYCIYRSTKPCDAFRAWWSAPGEPRVDAYMCELYK